MVLGASQLFSEPSVKGSAGISPCDLERIYQSVL